MSSGGSMVSSGSMLFCRNDQALNIGECGTKPLRTIAAASGAAGVTLALAVDRGLIGGAKL